MNRPSVVAPGAGGPRSRHAAAKAARRRAPLASLVAGAALVCSVAALAPAGDAFGAAARTTATARITADWKAFFAGTTPAARKIALLEDGGKFAAIIRGQASSPLARGVAAKVLKVTLTSRSSAKVRYSLTIGGKPALSNQTGTAVLQQGTWKVGDASFCALLGLEQVKSAACPKR